MGFGIRNERQKHVKIILIGKSTGMERHEHSWLLGKVYFNLWINSVSVWNGFKAFTLGEMGLIVSTIMRIFVSYNMGSFLTRILLPGFCNQYIKWKNLNRSTLHCPFRALSVTNSLHQTNKMHKMFLDIYFLMSHWTFLHVSIRKGSSSGYQTKSIDHKTKLADLVICALVRLPDDDSLRIESRRNVRCDTILWKSKEKYCEYFWVTIVN